MEKKEISRVLALLPELRFESIEENGGKSVFFRKLGANLFAFFKFLVLPFVPAFMKMTTFLSLFAAALIPAAIIHHYIIEARSLSNSTKAEMLIGLTAVFFFMIMASLFLGTLEGKSIKKGVYQKARICLECKDRKVKRDSPYCPQCFEQAIERIFHLEEETKGKIQKSLELGLEKQAEGTVNYFLENLPEPIKFLIEEKRQIQANQILEELRKEFPRAELLNPEDFDEYPVDTNEPEVNIPLEGLEVLEKLEKLLGRQVIAIGGKEVKQLKNGR